MFTHEPQEATAMLEPGVYDATIHGAEQKTSKKGSPMIEMNLHVYTSAGEPVSVYDYLVSTPAAAWKIRNFCAAMGLDYDAGAIDVDALLEQNLRVKIGVEKQEGYEPKNKVISYVVRENESGGHAPTSAAPPLKDDDIPF